MVKYNTWLCYFIIAITATLNVNLANADEDNTWRKVDAENLLIMELEAGKVIIELAPQFAPKHVANIKTLVSQGYFNGSAIIRSHDNYVAQWGDPNHDNERRRTLGKANEKLSPEFYRNLSEINYTPIVSRDAYAEEVGFVDGFPVATDKQRAWLTHCYGAVGVGRDMAPDSGNGSSLYAVTGHAPRHLDLNVTLVGRVIQGMELLSSLPRGTETLGFYKSEAQHVPIKSITMPQTAPAISVMRTDSAAFAKHVTNRTHRSHEWFLTPTGKIELCNVGVPVNSD